MRHRFVFLLVCLPLCVVLVPNNSPVAMSVPQPSPEPPRVVEHGGALPDTAEMDRLAVTDAVAFLDACLRHQVRNIRGYSGVLCKTERIRGKLQPREVIDFWFSESPYRVLMKWREGSRGAKASLYVEGANENRIAILTRLNVVLDLDPDGRLVQDGGRYNIREFSMRQGTERTLRAWSAAQERGILRVEYLGRRTVPEADGRSCYVLRRTCDPPEEEGVVTVKVVIDAEHWLQVGSELIDGNGNLIGSYYFTGLSINPEFAADQFDRSALRKR
ncbi:MAG: DUF1571 domain-containing protein [Gemmataceae bacterium]|nr:DUF1571 domain-containing protein [Gemmataceae bacterium]